MDQRVTTCLHVHMCVCHTWINIVLQTRLHVHMYVAARAIAVQAALAGREGRGKEAPMASRRTAPNTVEGPTAPPTSSPPLLSNPPPPQGQSVLSPSTSNTSIDSDEKGGRVLSSTPIRQPVLSTVLIFILYINYIQMTQYNKVFLCLPPCDDVFLVCYVSCSVMCVQV